MIIEGFFDGTAVKPIKPVDLKLNQKVFIQIPAPAVSAETAKDRKERQKKALNDLFGLLNEDESHMLDESISRHLTFKTMEI